ncbi:MAG: S-layer homology domain-containing protein [Firmicutes bacterium]|nr:S-layer homology domain-containing protein [Bacillota bacterium]
MKSSLTKIIACCVMGAFIFAQIGEVSAFAVEAGELINVAFADYEGYTGLANRDGGGRDDGGIPFRNQPTTVNFDSGTSGTLRGYVTAENAGLPDAAEHGTVLKCTLGNNELNWIGTAPVAVFADYATVMPTGGTLKTVQHQRFTADFLAADADNAWLLAFRGITSNRTITNNPFNLIQVFGGEIVFINSTESTNFDNAGYPHIRMPCTVGEWYNIEVLVNFEDYTYDAWLNGVLVAKNLEFGSPNAKSSIYPVSFLFRTLNKRGGTAGVDGSTGGVDKTFYLDNISLDLVDARPVISTVTPKNGFGDFPVNGGEIVFSSSKELDIANVPNVLVKDSGGTVILSETTVDGKKIIVTFPQQLEFSTAYTATLPAGSQSVDGAATEADESLTFTTMQKGLSVGQAKFSDNGGVPLSTFPPDGTVKADVQIFNPFDAEEPAALIIAAYDEHDNMVACNIKEDIIPAGAAKPFTASINLGGIGTIVRISAFAVESLENLSLLHSNCVSLTSTGVETEILNGDTGEASVAVDTPEVVGQNIVISGRVAPAGYRMILLGITQPDGSPLLILPFFSGIDGSFRKEFLLPTSGASGTYSIKVGGRQINTEIKALSYMNPGERQTLLDNINNASSLAAVEMLLEGLRPKIQLDGVNFNKNAYMAIFEQQPYAAYDEILETLVKATSLLSELNTLNWAEMSAYLISNHSVVLYNNADVNYYMNLAATEKNKINIIIAEKTSFANFGEFRTTFSNAIAKYKISLNTTSKGGGGGSGGQPMIVSGVKPEPITAPVAPPALNENNEKEYAFADLADFDWAKEAVSNLYKTGIINGDGNGNFHPGNPVTRAEFIKMAVCALELGIQESTGEEWYLPYLNTAQANGIIEGDENGDFHPNDQISRQDMAVIVYRMVTLQGFKITGEKVNIFIDDAGMSDYAKQAIYALSQVEIVSGIGDGLFSPLDFANRAQAAKMIYNFVDTILKNRG